MNLRRIALHLTFVAILVLTTAVVAAGVDYVFWTTYISRLEDRQKPKTDEFTTIPDVSPITLRRLGQIFTYKESSFVNFDRLKPQGVVRIGVFGDSYSYGDEVDEESDYPTQLDRLLLESGIANVEVLNFGTSWFGFGQTHIMWDEVGRDFGLDYILLGPATFFPDRDIRFNHSFGTSPYYLHSRYILDNGETRLIDLPGKSHAERFHNYYSFIPDRNVLRYDRGDPAFLAALLPSDRTLGNPFYYDKRSSEAEAADIQRNLFEDMKKSGTPILTAIYPHRSLSAVKPAAKDLMGENFCITQFDRSLKFPYLAQWAHNSPTGNALLARQYLATLLGHPVDVQIVRTGDLEENAMWPLVSGDLSSLDSVHIKINDVEAGVFSPLYPYYGDRKAPSFLREGQVKSLIGLKAPGSSLLDGVFIALRNDVPAGAPLRVILQSPSGAETTDLGNLRPLASGLNLGNGNLPGLELRHGMLDDYKEIVVNTSGWAELSKARSPNALLRVLIGEQVIIEGVESQEPGVFVLQPVNAEFLVVRGASREDLSTGREVGKGDVNLELSGKSQTYAIPIARWWVEEQKLIPAPECSSLPALTDLPQTRVQPGATKIVVIASGDEFDGAPQMGVYLDGKPIGNVQVTASHRADEWQRFTFTVDSDKRPSLLTLELTNDKSDQATKRDRALFIKRVFVNSRKLPLEDGFDLNPKRSSAGNIGEPRPIVQGRLAFWLAGPNDH